MKRFQWTGFRFPKFSARRSRRRKSRSQLSQAAEVCESRTLLSATYGDDSNSYEPIPDLVFEVSGSTAQEGEALQFTISFPEGVIGEHTISYDVSGETAYNGADFAYAYGEFQVSSNEPITVEVPTMDDIVDEYDELLQIWVSSDSTTQFATGVIEDNDDAPFIDILTGQSVDEMAGQVEFIVNLSRVRDGVRSHYQADGLPARMCRPTLRRRPVRVSARVAK